MLPYLYVNQILVLPSIEVFKMCICCSCRGFKGKNSLPESTPPLPPGQPQARQMNTFSNDGSFFEQFKKMNEAVVKVETPKPTPVRAPEPPKAAPMPTTSTTEGS